MLAALSSAIGTSRVVEVKGGWREWVSLFVTVVASPGAMKTPAAKVAEKPAFERQRRLGKSYAEDEEYGHGRHDRVRDELIQQWVHDPSAWSGRGDKIVFRSEDIHGTITKLKRDIPDYLYGSGSRGNVIVFDATELEKFLGISLSSGKGPLDSLARLFRR